MKKIICIMLLVAVALTVRSQILYDQTKELTKALNEKKCIPSDLIIKYGLDSSLIKQIVNCTICSMKKIDHDRTINEIYIDVQKDNNFSIQQQQFLRNYLQTLLQGSDKQTSPKTDVIESFLPTPAVLIDGTAQFLVERTKMELNIAFIEKFRKAFKENEDFKILFPNVSNVVLYNDPLNFSFWGSQLKTAAQTDIYDLPVNYSILIKTNSKYKNLSSSEKELLEVFLIVARTLQFQASGTYPANTLKQINAMYGFNSNPENKLVINKAVSFAEAISKSFFRNNAYGYVPIDSILALSDKEKVVFAKLFAIENKYLLDSINISDSTLYELLIKISEDKIAQVNDIFTFAGQLSNSYKILLPSVSILKDSTNIDLRRDAYKKANNYISEFYEIGFLLYYMNNDEMLYGTNGYYLRYKPIINSSVQMINHLLDRNYPGALVSFNNIAIKTLSLTAGSAVDSVTAKTKKTIEQLVYWGGFITEIAMVDSSCQVNDLLKKYAEPVGSYRIKRNSLASVSINAYPGLFVGGEMLRHDSKDIKFSSEITAPIGFSFNWACKKEITHSADFDVYKNGKAKKYRGDVWGFFVPVIDIGAPFVYRWSYDSTNGFPDELKWEHIFSPGLFVSYGFKNSGMTLMLGGQFSPALRKINEDGFELREDTYRFGITLTYDIPIFTLYKKQEYKK